MPTRFPDVRKSLSPALIVALGALITVGIGVADVGAQCENWSASGSADAADGSTVPGPVLFYVMNFPQPGQATYTGYAAARSQHTISGSGSMGGSPSSQHPVYAVSTGYFTSPLGGPITCVKPENDCGTCSGSFSLSLYATEGAIQGTVTVKPALQNGFQGAEVWRASSPTGAGGIRTPVDATGKFEFRSQTEPARSNNWGVPLNAGPDGGMGQAQFYVGLAGSPEPGVGPVTVQSSQLVDASFTVRNPNRGGGSPEIRGPTSVCDGPPTTSGPGGGGNGPGSGPGRGGGPPPPKAADACESAGKPVHTSTGNVYFDQTDVSVPGVQGLVFVRSYNSRLAYANVGSGFGRGWTHSYGRSLSFPDSRSIDLRGDNGVPIYFQDLDADGVFEAVLPATHETWLAQTGEGYTRHFPGGAYETYDSAGRLTSVVDVAGNVTTLARDTTGRLVRVTDAGGRALELAYDASGRISALYVGATGVASYGYDGVGWNLLESVRYPDGSGYDFTADTLGQILRVTDAAGRPIESHVYDSAISPGYGLTSEVADGREKLTFAYEPFKTTVTDPRGAATEYHWTWVDALRRVTKIVGPCPSCGTGGQETKEWTYDSQGRVTSTRRSGQEPTLYDHDPGGRLSSVTDPLGRTTSYTYDGQGRVLSVSQADGGLVSYTYGPHGVLTVSEKLTATTTRTTSYTYTPRGQVHTVTDPRGKVTTYAYTAAGDLESVTDPLGHTTTFEYDALGRRTKVTDALGHATSTVYDGRGRATRVTSADGTHTDFAYDLSGRRTSVTDPLGRVTRWVYDEYGRLASVVDPLDGVTRYAYDLAGALSSLTDAKGQTTSFAHDTAGRVSAVTYPGGAQETYTYDASGRLQTRTDRRGIVTTYTYDGVGRLTGKTYSNGDTAVVYTYDAAGRLATAANGTDTLTWSYDLAGQLLSEQSARNGTAVGYTHDLAGNRLSLSLDGQLFVSYAYDDAGRLGAITRASSVFGFAYDDANRRTSMSYPNGVVTSYAYDEVNRLTSLHAVHGGATTITSFGYTYDAAGNRLTKSTPEFTESYDYDPLYRLTGVERTGGPTGLWRFGWS